MKGKRKIMIELIYMKKSKKQKIKKKVFFSNFVCCYQIYKNLNLKTLSLSSYILQDFQTQKRIYHPQVCDTEAA